jgi:hypothetical protein
VSARLRNHKGRFLVACDHREKLSTGIDAVIGPQVISKSSRRFADYAVATRKLSP